MRVLLDEHLDRRLKPLFDNRFEVVTIHEHGWSGKKNGMLLQAAQAEFDALVTMDWSIEYQQNLQKLALAIVILRAPSNRRQDTEPLIPKVNDALATIRPGEVIHISAEV